MSEQAGQQDLVVLVPGKDDEAALSALLGRPQSLGIRPLTFTTHVHPRRDPGCFAEADKLLRPLCGQYAHALVVFDRIGCGHEGQSVIHLEQRVLGRLHAAGWGDRAGVVVIDPELEVWIWADSPLVDEHLGWKGRSPGLREWLSRVGLWGREGKPADPKRAVERALRSAGVQRSSSIYGDLAGAVSLGRCQDLAFGRFRALLRRWFPVSDA